MGLNSDAAALVTPPNGTPATAVIAINTAIGDIITQTGDAPGGTSTVSGRLDALESAIATLTAGSGMVVIRQNSDGSWPLRSTVTSDPNRPVEWRCKASGTPPAVGGGYMQDVAANSAPIDTVLAYT